MWGNVDDFGGSDDDDFCEECGGDGCWECGCEDQFEFVQCRGITLRGTRCQITSDSASGFGKFADAAYPLTCGSYYCTFHTQQEWERDESDECWECGGEGCPECCFECDGRGCEECEEEWGYAASSSQQRQAYQTPAAIPAAPSQDEVAIVGYRSRQERDAEARRHAIDLDSESEATPDKAEACAAEAKPASKRCAQPASKLAAQPAKPASKLPAKPAKKPTQRAKPAAKLPAKPAKKPTRTAKPAAKLIVKPLSKPAARTRTVKPAAKLIAEPLTEPAARSRPATRLAARSA